MNSKLGRTGVHPGCFWQRVSKRLERKKIHFALLQESERVKTRAARTECPTIGNPDGYQKKGVTGEAKGIVVKTKGIANVAQIWARGRGLRGSSGKSGVETFEWNLITFVSVVRPIVLNQ